eukprot:gnl/TRDRNA2_/TRDRNA2_130014_c1_seq1.p1 gnl/TRDRNA2_/TRDRNA2_130014_c1~~gnl/TRDRNA2_/TRDRNA2_130014_c1_seq1.p1  ORF type:complete len:933 (+),score=256.63 gnl/TRDRNA2_/TRDRNA2_130014_c1_seq1:116-2800(+)
MRREERAARDRLEALAKLAEQRGDISATEEAVRLEMDEHRTFLAKMCEDSSMAVLSAPALGHASSALVSHAPAALKELWPPTSLLGMQNSATSPSPAALARHSPALGAGADVWDGLKRRLVATEQQNEAELRRLSAEFEAEAAALQASIQSCRAAHEHTTISLQQAEALRHSMELTIWHFLRLHFASRPGSEAALRFAESQCMHAEAQVADRMPMRQPSEVVAGAAAAESPMSSLAARVARLEAEFCEAKVAGADLRRRRVEAAKVCAICETEASTVFEAAAAAVELQEVQTQLQAHVKAFAVYTRGMVDDRSLDAIGQDAQHEAAMVKGLDEMRCAADEEYRDWLQSVQDPLKTEATAAGGAHADSLVQLRQRLSLKAKLEHEFEQLAEDRESWRRREVEGAELQAALSAEAVARIGRDSEMQELCARRTVQVEELYEKHRGICEEHADVQARLSAARTVLGKVEAEVREMGQQEACEQNEIHSEREEQSAIRSLADLRMEEAAAGGAQVAEAMAHLAPHRERFSRATRRQAERAEDQRRRLDELVGAREECAEFWRTLNEQEALHVELMQMFELRYRYQAACARTSRRCEDLVVRLREAQQQSALVVAERQEQGGGSGSEPQPLWTGAGRPSGGDSSWFMPLTPIAEEESQNASSSGMLDISMISGPDSSMMSDLAEPAETARYPSAAADAQKALLLDAFNTSTREALMNLHERQLLEVDALEAQEQVLSAEQGCELEAAMYERNAVEARLDQARHTMEQQLELEIQHLAVAKKQEEASAVIEQQHKDSVVPRMSVVMRETYSFLCEQQSRLERVLRERDEVRNRLLETMGNLQGQGRYNQAAAGASSQSGMQDDVVVVLTAEGLRRGSSTGEQQWQAPPRVADGDELMRVP